MKFSCFNFEDILSKRLVLFAGKLQKIFGAIENCGRRSDIVVVRLPAITSFQTWLGKIYQSILSILSNFR